MSYQDKWGRFHDKPTNGVNPSSNNGWIYTAYAYHLGLCPGLTLSLDECFEESKRGNWPKVDRSPGKMFPPLSRDEVLGLFVLGLVFYKELKNSYWQFCNLPGFVPKPLWKVNWFKALRAAWKIRNAHRTALHDEPDLWHLGFRLPPQDTWFIMKVAEIEPGMIHTLYFYVSSLLTIFRKSGNVNSGKLILWLKLTELKMQDSFLYTLLEPELAFQGYFGDEHPFVEAIK